MELKIVRLGLGVLASITIILLISSITTPELFMLDAFLGLTLLLCTALAILAPFSVKLRYFKIITWVIFGAASLANIFWFFIFEFSFYLYFAICNLCFGFIYALFFIMMPYYAIKYQSKYEQSSIKGYHIHENTYGIMLILLGFLSIYIAWWWPNTIELLRFFILHILSFFAIFCMIMGAFFIGRDYQDFLKLKFIERLQTRILDPNFNIRQNFYRTSPFGIVFTLFGISSLIQNRLLSELLHFDRSIFITAGFILIILGGIISGLNPTFFAKKANILK